MGPHAEDPNITPFPVWYQGKPSQRIADQLHFIYTTQRDYYAKFEAAVRKTGYKGQLIGSCWQAADWVGHLYNVLADRRSPAAPETFGQPGAGSGDPRTAADARTAATYALGEVTITPKTPFCNIYATAPGKEETIANSKSLLITATARMVDRNTVFDDLSERPLVAAPFKKGPVVLEPVAVTIELKRIDSGRVFALDHGGRKTDPPAEVPLEQMADGCRIVLDGAKYRTPYTVNGRFCVFRS